MTDDQKEIMEKMDKAADLARAELVEIVGKYPDASEAFGSWMKKHKDTAGWKRLGQQIIVL